MLALTRLDLVLTQTPALTPYEAVMMMLVIFFFVGLTSFVSGLLILTFRAFGPDTKAIVQQTTQLAQKGIEQDLAGLVGNAAALLDTLKAMVDTAKGIGLLLVIVGLGIMALTSVLALRVYTGAL